MTKNNHTTHWPVFIISIGAAFAAFSWWSIDRAISDVSTVSDPDYYAHGLKYHSASLDAQTAATTGWTFTPRLDGETLMITIRDANNSNITGCHAVIAFPTDTNSSKSIAPLALTEVGDGKYSGTLPAGLPASVSVTLTLTKDQATTQRQLLINRGS